MAVRIEKMCLDRDQPRSAPVKAPHVQMMPDKWHPAARLLFIAGSAASLWAILLTVFA